MPNKRKREPNGASQQGAGGTPGAKKARNMVSYSIKNADGFFQPAEYPHEDSRSGVGLSFNYWASSPRRALTCENVTTLLQDLLVNSTTPCFLRESSDAAAAVDAVCIVAVPGLDCVTLAKELQAGALPTLSQCSSTPLRYVDVHAQNHKLQLAALAAPISVVPQRASPTTAAADSAAAGVPEQWLHWEAEALTSLVLWVPGEPVTIDDLQGVHAHTLFMRYRLSFRAETNKTVFQINFQRDAGAATSVEAALSQIAGTKSQLSTTDNLRWSVEKGDVTGRFHCNAAAEAGLYFYRRAGDMAGRSSRLVLVWHKAQEPGRRLQVLTELPVVNRRGSFSDSMACDTAPLSFSLEVQGEGEEEGEDLFLELEAALADSSHALDAAAEETALVTYPDDKAGSMSATDLAAISKQFAALSADALSSLVLSPVMQEMMRYPTVQDATSARGDWLLTASPQSVRRALKRGEESAVGGVLSAHGGPSGESIATPNGFGTLGVESSSSEASSSSSSDTCSEKEEKEKGDDDDDDDEEEEEKEEEGGWGGDESPDKCPGTSMGALEVVAIDCEMCATEKGPALTRVTLVCPTRGVVYDELVLPAHKITDYLTAKSGITEELMANVCTRLADVQAQLARLLRPSTLLIGHSLQGDLRALQLVHANCIDTAACFPHPRGLPFKHSLKALAHRHLGRSIQDAVAGHDSVEDARAALELALLAAASAKPFLPQPWEGTAVPRQTLLAAWGVDGTSGGLSARAFCTSAIASLPVWELHALGYRAEADSAAALPGTHYSSGDAALVAASQFLADNAKSPEGQKEIVWVDLPFDTAPKLEKHLRTLCSSLDARASNGLLLVLSQGGMGELRRILAMKQILRWEKTKGSGGNEGGSSSGSGRQDELESMLIQEAAHVLAGAVFLRRTGAAFKNSQKSRGK